jgi:transposase
MDANGALADEFPNYSTVHSFYRRARLSGLWEKVLRAMAEKTRVKAGETLLPVAGLSIPKVSKRFTRATNAVLMGEKNERPQEAHYS